MRHVLVFVEFTYGALKVYINIAASVDGKISNKERHRLDISSNEDFRRVDELRARSDAVMVGIGTILSDDSSLLVKNDELRRQHGDPIRVVVDSRARLPLDSKVLEGDAETAVGVGRRADRDAVSTLRERAKVIQTTGEETDLDELITALGEMGVSDLMVEGGGTLNYSLIERGLVDEIFIYSSNMVIGGDESPGIVDGDGFTGDYPELDLMEVEELGGGLLHRWRVL